MTDSVGAPIPDGTYTMRFQIYNQLIGGSPLWDSGNQNIDVSNCIFNIMLGSTGQPDIDLAFDTDYWLLISFDGEVLTPRRKLGSVGYAFIANGLVPGAVIEDSLSNSGILVCNNTAVTGIAVGIQGTTESGDGAGVFGYSGASEGPAPGVLGRSASTDGVGVYGYVSSTTGETCALYGHTNSTEGKGVSGLANRTTGTSYGMYGESASTSGTGVYGYASATEGTTYGVHGKNNSSYGSGVYGEATATSSIAVGVYGTTESGDGAGIFGYYGSSEGSAPAVLGRSASTNGFGVYGYVSSTTGETCAVYGHTNSTEGKGVSGLADRPTGTSYGMYGESASISGTGVYGYASATEGTTYGVHGDVFSDTGWGLYTPKRASIGMDLWVEGPMVYTPSTNLSLNAGSTLTITNTIMRVQGSFGPVTLGLPSLSAGNDGQLIIIQGTNDANTVSFVDDGSTPGTLMELNDDSAMVLGNGDTITLVYSASDSRWYEVSRSDN